jgi:hypothetical protein
MSHTHKISSSRPLPSDENLVAVHGRASLKIPYTRWSVTNGVETKVDISTATIFVEIPTAGIRRQLQANPSDPEGLLIFLPREDVEKLPTTPVPFAVIDETLGGSAADLDWHGMIVRTGYKGAPGV